MSQNVNPDAKSTNPVDNSASTPPAQPAANVPAGVNPGAPVTTTPGVTLDNATPTPTPDTKPAQAPGAQGTATSTPSAPSTPEVLVDASSQAAADAPVNAPAPVTPSPAPTASAAPAAAPAPKPEDAAVVKVNSYIPGGLSKDVVNPIPNPAQTDQNFPFSAGRKMHEVAQYQNFFTFPLDTYYNIFDAIYYFSDENNRNRYTYDQQQIIISRIVRAAKDFGIPIEGIRDKLTL